jgi:hypothetical protein
MNTQLKAEHGAAIAIVGGIGCFALATLMYVVTTEKEAKIMIGTDVATVGVVEEAGLE